MTLLEKLNKMPERFKLEDLPPEFFVTPKEAITPENVPWYSVDIPNYIAQKTSEFLWAKISAIAMHIICSLDEVALLIGVAGLLVGMAGHRKGFSFMWIGLVSAVFIKIFIGSQL